MRAVGRGLPPSDTSSIPFVGGGDDVLGLVAAVLRQLQQVQLQQSIVPRSIATLGIDRRNGRRAQPWDDPPGLPVWQRVELGDSECSLRCGV